jgi:CDP-diglyceride synthetase
VTAVSMKAFWLGALPALLVLTVAGAFAAPVVNQIAEPWRSVVLIAVAIAVFTFAGWLTQRILDRRRGT